MFGRACANRVKQILKPGTPHVKLPDDASLRAVDNLDRFRNASGSTPTAVLRLQMQKVMQNFAAVYRTGETLEEGVKKIDEVAAAFEKDVKVTDRSLVW